jgi:Fe-only nitrogenase accessory protein AnfO
MFSVAVIEDQNGLTASLTECREIVIYSKSEDETEWAITGEINAEIDASKGMAAARAALDRLIARLGETRIIVGKNISGVIYHKLNTAGFAVFEIMGKPERYLDYVISKAMREEDAPPEEYPDHPLPADREGCYTLNLTELQLRRPEVSSKMAILPFVQNKVFDELKVTCGHLPPWFNKMLGPMGLSFTVTEHSGSLCVSITPAACQKQ